MKPRTQFASAQRAMRWRGKHCAIALLLRLLIMSFALAPGAFAGEIVDRVVTSVNGHVVLQSDWEQEVAFEAFSSGREPESFTSEERNAALDRLIDQELLREQVRPSQPAPADQVAARVAEVRKLHPDCASEDRWHAALQRYGLTQKDVEKRLSDQIQLMKMVEDRLRPSIHIDQKTVEAYYHDQLLPELKKAGSTAKPLTEVFARIKDLLAEKKMNELLSGWLANLRSASQIRPSDSSAPKQKDGDQSR